MMRMASVVFGLLTVGLLGYGGYRYAFDRDAPEPPPGEALAVDEPDRDLGAQPQRGEATVRFRVRNRLAQPVQVLGLVPCCGNNACFGPKRMDPFVIPARGEVEIEFEAHTGDPGPFSCPMYIHFFDRGLQGIKMTAKGTWVAPRSADHGPTPSP
jgi:hypothetical protein